MRTIQATLVLFALILTPLSQAGDNVDEDCSKALLTFRKLGDFVSDMIKAPIQPERLLRQLRKQPDLSAWRKYEQIIETFAPRLSELTHPQLLEILDELNMPGGYRATQASFDLLSPKLITSLKDYSLIQIARMLKYRSSIAERVLSAPGFKISNLELEQLLAKNADEFVEVSNESYYFRNYLSLDQMVAITKAAQPRFTKELLDALLRWVPGKLDKITFLNEISDGQSPENSQIIRFELTALNERASVSYEEFLREIDKVERKDPQPDAMIFDFVEKESTHLNLSQLRTLADRMVEYEGPAKFMLLNGWFLDNLPKISEADLNIIEKRLVEPSTFAHMNAHFIRRNGN